MFYSLHCGLMGKTHALEVKEAQIVQEEAFNSVSSLFLLCSSGRLGVAPSSSQLKLKKMDTNLILDFHALFLDSCASGCNTAGESSLFSIKQRPVLRGYSREYRRALRRSQDSGDKDEAERNHTKVSHSIWHMAEAALLSGGADAPPVLALLECLREDFLCVEDLTILVNDVVSRLKLQSAATDDLLAFDTFDVMVRLALQGSARDAGNLLRILALLRHDSAILAVAELLSSFPSLGVVAVGAGSMSYASSWEAWRAKAVVLRQQFSDDHSQALQGTIWSTNLPTEPSLFNTTKALLDVLSGRPLTESSNSPLKLLKRKGTLINNYLEESGVDWAWNWSYICLSFVLYGSNTSPSLYGRSSLKAAMESSIRAVGLGILYSETQVDSISEQMDDDVEETGALLNGALIKTVDGDALASISMLRRTSCCGHIGNIAATHLTDLLWRAGHFNSPPHQDSEPDDFSLRSRLLIGYSKDLLAQSPDFSRIAISYALAATPESAMALCRIPPFLFERLLTDAKSSPVASDAAVTCAMRSSTSAEAISAILLSSQSSSLSPALQTAKLALASGTAIAGIASGGVSNAYVTASEIIKASPLQSDRDCASLISIVSRSALPIELSRWISRGWARKCRERGHPGSAMIWALRMNDVEQCDMVANVLQQQMDVVFSSEFLQGGAMRPLTYAVVANKLRIVDECARVIDEVLFSVSGHREDNLDCSGLALLPPQLDIISLSSAFLRLRHTRKLVALMLYGALESDRRYKTQLSSSTLSTETRAVDEDIGALFCSAGNHLARLVEINPSGDSLLLNPTDVAQLVSVCLLCGIFHAGLRPQGTLGLDLADEETYRMKSPIVEDDINAILTRVEVDRKGIIGLSTGEASLVRAALGNCAMRAMR